MTVTPQSDVTQILARLADGEQSAEQELYPLVYDELRAQAAGLLRHERKGHTLQPTALVHEAYLRLVDQKKVRAGNRAYFFATSAAIMRRILVDHARARRAGKRGGDHQRVPLDGVIDVAEQRCSDILEFDEALTTLARHNPRLARVVDLRFFGEMSVEDTARVLDVSTRTVEADWRAARAILFRKMNAG